MAHIILYAGKPVKLPEVTLLDDADAAKATQFADKPAAHKAIADEGLNPNHCRVVALAKFIADNT